MKCTRKAIGQLVMFYLTRWPCFHIETVRVLLSLALTVALARQMSPVEADINVAVQTSSQETIAKVSDIFVHSLASAGRICFGYLYEVCRSFHQTVPITNIWFLVISKLTREPGRPR